MGKSKGGRTNLPTLHFVAMRRSCDVHITGPNLCSNSFCSRVILPILFKFILHPAIEMKIQSCPSFKTQIHSSLHTPLTSPSVSYCATTPMMPPSFPFTATRHESLPSVDFHHFVVAQSVVHCNK